ncbi:DNA-binding protein HU [bacterium CG_4_10_14_0_2_um_filter_33_32]|nr:MAG: hypothetical protein AUJ93_04480 [bacterium CG2_30_33_46]PIR67422.1 MAG: DNA-binding protein HU [bacterium CG10_big_fil_rev_8_21_14_0_10_33_18]PIU76621.1 MAG: DNA-binding protein HU [bacterium CG06_land_8_20_14_3_00_33_50]PIY85294.1 MAG: DNA-binding protein HU [bacterium CG_4_10_14_0_8_um_filter_33_57]PIZ85235.1 MAG: DNA-binding protein HU [bacterium CG_4_10_14_0_2_um_filter_33_32]PJA71894.1 MAG: DNA-binding protein HU [bacterium CG_4_9_14_3_um_filter_33_26]
MTKEQLLEVVANKSNLSQQAVNNLLKILGEVITESLRKGEKVAVSGIGVFDVNNRASRRARNPQTGEIMKIPAMRIPCFRAAVGLKKAVRK